jgi:hypothetical protein
MISRKRYRRLRKVIQLIRDPSQARKWLQQQQSTLRSLFLPAGDEVDKRVDIASACRGHGGELGAVAAAHDARRAHRVQGDDASANPSRVCCCCCLLAGAQNFR